MIIQQGLGRVGRKVKVRKKGGKTRNGVEAVYLRERGHRMERNRKREAAKVRRGEVSFVQEPE
jgi:hypothetical protein